MCEKDGFIPRYYTDGPQDKVDRTLQDLQTYTHDLIMNETNLSALIEKAVKDINEQKEKEAIQDADAASDDDTFEDLLFDEGKGALLQDSDFSDLFELEEEAEAADDKFLSSLLEEGEIQ